ncbi:hypothetical protein [Paraburkholderia sp. A3RO-2L]|uniref:hypothetical protein n=1 Tax=unclassified Paraburkholderia TaxID=2615204 RepID=UPI003303EE31|nr:hypothetical protein [Burkholderia vietnamiensis]
MSTITGLEFKKFHSDDTLWDGEAYHDDILIKASSGAVWSDSDDLDTIPDSAQLTINSGWVQDINPELTGGPTDMSLQDFYNLWKSKQATPLRVLVVECTADDEERVRAAILAAGGTISA